MNPDFPPLYYARLRRARRQWWLWFATLAALSIFSGASFVWDWNPFLSVLAPFVNALWIYSSAVAFLLRADSNIARVVPYFPKKAPRVEADTHFHGYALARNFQILEAWALERAVPPLSTLGWADDLGGETPVWHDAARGVEVVMVLLECPLAPDVREDLRRLEAALRSAQHVGAPFCLLLLQGQSTSGWEMTVRAGNFGWLSRAADPSNSRR